MISYDIKDNRRRNKVCNELKNYGEHVQYSVFDCQLSRKQFSKLKKELNHFINNRQDNIRYYFLCRACIGKIIVQGKKFPELV